MRNHTFPCQLHRIPFAAFNGSRKLREKLSFANFSRKVSHVRSVWGQTVVSKVLKLFALDNNRAIWSNGLQSFLMTKVSNKSYAARLLPIHVKHPPLPHTHVDPLPPHTRARRTIHAIDEWPSQNTRTTSWDCLRWPQLCRTRIC
ncbi:unnamed protein product [Ectocarpus sp. 12 AP-2014]